MSFAVTEAKAFIISEEEDPGLEGKESRPSAEADSYREKSGGVSLNFDPLQRYLFEIKRYRLLTREEEIELATRVKEGDDENAVRRLVNCNLRLVVKIAMDLQRYWNGNLLDLIQEGNLGLMQAVRKFDPHRGIKFSYYASFWIKAYILKFVMDNWKLVKIGTTQSQRKLFFNLGKERDSLIAQGVDPEPRVLAKRLDVREEEVIEMSQRMSGWELSLSAPEGDDGREGYGSVLPDAKKNAYEQLCEDQSRQTLDRKLKQFRKTLLGREVDIFDRRILAEKPATLRELGHKHHISRERVRQLQGKIMKNVNKWLKKEIPNFEEEYGNLIG